MLSVTALTTALLAASPKIGELAPDFNVTDIDGRPLRLSTLVQNGPVVLAFFPKAFTPGCTKEMQSFRDRYRELEQSGAQLFAVSTDDAATQRRFKDELGAPFTFIPDPKGELTELYDVKVPVLTFAKRTTFVIGNDRRVKAVFSGGDAIDPSGAINSCRGD